MYTKDTSKFHGKQIGLQKDNLPIPRLLLFLGLPNLTGSI